MIKELLKRAGEDGMRLPFVYDAATKQPSVTLLFLYITNILAICSLVLLHIVGDKLIATITTCTYSIVWAVLYLMRKLQKAKFDLKDQSFELDSGDVNAKKDS